MLGIINIITNLLETSSYTLSGKGQSSVGFANGKADIKLVEKNGVTTLIYEVNVNVGGKIAQLGSRLIDGVAKKMTHLLQHQRVEVPVLIARVDGQPG